MDDNPALGYLEFMSQSFCSAATIAAHVPRHADNVARMNTSKSEAASILGSSTSNKKAAAAQKNGEKGGRPKGS